MLLLKSFNSSQRPNLCQSTSSKYWKLITSHVVNKQVELCWTHMKAQLTLSADAVLQALIMIRSSMRLSLTSPQPDWMMYTSSPLTLSPISTLVSPLANFWVLTLAWFTPSLSQIFWARSWWELPENTLMFGIVCLELCSWGWVGQPLFALLLYYWLTTTKVERTRYTAASLSWTSRGYSESYANRDKEEGTIDMYI